MQQNIKKFGKTSTQTVAMHMDMYTHDMSLRIGTKEREDAVDSLRIHAEDGRLDEVELERRIEDAYEAVFQSDLNDLFVDLPRVHSKGEMQQWKRHQRITFYHQLGIYTPVSFFLVAIASGGLVGLWLPLIIIFAWGASLMNQAIRIRTQPVLDQIDAAKPAQLGRGRGELMPSRSDSQRPS